MDTPHINLTISLCIPCTDEVKEALHAEDTYEAIRTALVRELLTKAHLAKSEVNYAYIYNEETTEQISVECLEIDDLLTSFNS